MEKLSQSTQPPLPWTGERFVPGEGGDIIALEHLHRYRLAQAYGKGALVLDLGCGAGYGSTMLKDSGASMVVGVDISFEAASFVKRQDAGLRIGVCSGDALPLRSSSVDLAVSFEVIEHVGSPELLVSEVRRVLRRHGTFIVSTPNKRVYNEFLTETNPFHVSEMELVEFHQLLSRHFENVSIWAQKVVLSSVVWGLDEDDPRPLGSSTSAPPAAPYLIAVCSDSEVQPLETSALSSWRMLEGLAEQAEHYAGYDARELAARAHIAALESSLEYARDALASSGESEAFRHEPDVVVKGMAAGGESADLHAELARIRGELAALERSRWVRLGSRIHSLPGVAQIDRILRATRRDDSIATRPG